LPSTVEKLSDTRVKILLTIEPDELAPAMKKAFRDLGSTMSIPGFRKGHIPEKIVETHLGKEAVLTEAVQEYLPAAYTQALETHQLTPLGQPVVELSTLSATEVSEVTMEVDILPSFDLPDFSALEVSVDASDDTEKTLTEKLAVLQERFAEVSDVDRPCEDGDQVVINLVARRDGEVLGDANAKGVTYVLGSGQMLDGLDEALLGSHLGDEKTFTSTLVGGPWEGESADITVTVTKVQARTLPEIDDEFASMVSQFDSVEEMKDDLRKAVEQMAVMDQFRQARSAILDEVISRTSFDVPLQLIDDETNRRTSTMLEQLKTAGMTLEDYLARVGDETMNTEKQFMESTRSSVERGIRAEIILDRIANESGIGVDQHDLTEFIIQRAQENQTTPEQEVEHMKEHDHLSEWMSQIRQAKALDSLVAGAKVSDPTGATIDMKAVMSASQPQVSDADEGDDSSS